jgi:hypothetical protein
MKKYSSRAPLVVSLLPVAFAAMLAACGGGGDSADLTGGGPVINPPVTPPVTPPPPAATGTLVVTSKICDVVAGASECNIGATAKTENAPNGVLVTPSGQQVSVVNTTLTVTVAVPVGTSSVQLKDGTKVLAQESLTASCVSTTVFDTASKKCVGIPVITLAGDTPATRQAKEPVVVNVAITGYNVTAATASATATCDGTPVPMQTATLATSGGKLEFAPQATWPAGTSCRYKVGADATNLAGTATQVFEGTFTVPKAPVTALRYDVIYAMVGFKVGMPARISGESCAVAKVEEAVNKTSFPERPEWNFALFSAHVLTTPAAGGLIHVAQQVVADDNKLRTFLLNPVTNEEFDDDGRYGPLPSLYPLDPAWKRVSPADHPDPVVGGWAQTEKLFVYVTRDTNELFCEDRVAGVRSGKPIKLTLTDEYGTIAGLWGFKN